MHEFPNQTPGPEQAPVKETQEKPAATVPATPMENIAAAPQPSRESLTERVAALESVLGPLSNEATEDIYKHTTGESADGEENAHPESTTEQEPRFLTLEDIRDKMNALLDTRTSGFEKPPRIKQHQDGHATLVEYEKKNNDGSSSIFSYIASGPRCANTVINIVHFRGDPDAGDYISGEDLSHYDEATGIWTDMPRYAPKDAQTPLQEIVKKYAAPVQEETLRKVIMMPLTDKDEAAEVDRLFKEVSAEGKREAIRELFRLFDDAESAFGTTDPTETDPSVVKEARDATKPLLNKAYAELIRLNKSEDRLPNPLGEWNPSGDLTEEQYDALNIRRKILSNAVGRLHKNPDGKFAIRHDLNDI